MSSFDEVSGCARYGAFRKISLVAQTSLLIVLLCLLANASAFAQTCPTEFPSIDNAKSHKLFLYFPTVPDQSFPSVPPPPAPAPWHPDARPAQPFDVADLSPSIGTTAQLIDGIKAVVVDDYCEFDVQVIVTTTNPAMLPSPPARRTTVAIGSDGTNMTKGDWGHADGVNTGYVSDVDFARVWAGFYTVCEGGAGPTVTSNPNVLNNQNAYLCSMTGALTGANATLENWAEAIGGSAAHEAGHTYGVAHKDDNPPNDPCAAAQPGYPPTPGEDPWNRHLMPSGCNLTGMDRIVRRHFSNRDYGILATNVGLSIETMHNWELINPNAESATALAIDFLSPLPSISIAWTYAGAQSPWRDPTVTGPSGTMMFKGRIYNKFQVVWSTGNPAWTDPSPGVVAGGAIFHIGTTFTGVDFNQPDPIIIQNVTLLDASGRPLALNPRLPAYDTGTASPLNHQFVLQFFAPPAAPGMRMVSAAISQLPQLATIDALMGEGRPRARDGRAIEPWASTRCAGGPLAAGIRCVVARLDQKPHFLDSYRLTQRNVFNCSQGIPLGLPVEAGQSGTSVKSLLNDEVRTCAGAQRDPFPSAIVYVIATFVDPNAKHYDAASKSYVVGPVTSKVYYQFAGVRRLPELLPKSNNRGRK